MNELHLRLIISVFSQI